VTFFYTHIEHALVVRMLIRLREKLWANPSKIISKFQAEFLRSRCAEILVKNRPCSGIGVAEPEPAVVGFFAGDYFSDSLSAIHLFQA
jgi:hypothetical protein